MPKISNNSVLIRHKDIDKRYDIVIMYNQKQHFYSTIPNEFKDVVHHFSEKEMEELFIVENRIGRYDSKEYTAIIEAETEAECLFRMKECLKILVGKSIEQRNVIIVFYNPKDNCNYNDHRYNKEHPQIGLQFALTYAIETSVGDKKVYSTYDSYEAFGETHINRHEMNLWNTASTIIPDTKENRKTLEQLYINLDKLNNKLKEFTSTPEKMLEFITTNVKMLGS
jgi:hypothetical protein